MKYKRIISIFLCICLQIMISACTYANNTDEVKVTIDGEYVEFDQPPVIIEGRTMVPLRKIFEKLGAKVEYDPETSTVYASKTDFEMSMKIGENKYTVNNTEYSLDVPSQIINDRTLVPVRAVSESMDCIVDWDGAARTVIILTQQALEQQALKVHFIDVGQADSALLICNDKTMLIDGGNVEDSSRVVSYLAKHNIDYLDYVVCTHAHEDHVGGLSGPLSVMDVGTIYAPLTEEDTRAYLNFKNKAEENGVEIVHPDCKEVFYLGDGKVEILGPVSEETNNLNNTSIVLKITYGETSFLFTGDAEYEEEQDIINMGYDLSADVLKVGHHGAENSSSYTFLREVMPEYAVISVGKDNKYSHPSENTLSRLRDVGAKVYRTDLQGDITFLSDGENITAVTQKNSEVQTNPTENTEKKTVQYIGNKNTKKYHRLDCSSLPKEENQIGFSSKEEAENQGYEPCSKCKP